MAKKKYRIYFGGTFDPPHVGHHQMMSVLLEDSYVEAIHVVPTFQNPLKETLGLASSSQRLGWVNQWLSTYKSKKVVLETLELDCNVTTYTVETLCEMQKTYPDSSWAMVVGGDICASFMQWKMVEKLFALIECVWIFPRLPQLNPLNDIDVSLRSLCQFRLFGQNIAQVSSTVLRQKLLDDTSETLNGLLAPNVKLDSPSNSG